MYEIHFILREKEDVLPAGWRGLNSSKSVDTEYRITTALMHETDGYTHIQKVNE